VAFHQAIQHPAAPPPRRLAPLLEAIGSERQRFEQRAVRFGNRYRSGFWAVYLLSAFAVLCAVLPLVLEWNTHGGLPDLQARVWAIAEVVLIGAVIAIYWWGHHRDWQGEWLRARAIAELAGYLPLLSPLVDFDKPGGEANWYVRAFNPGQHSGAMDDLGSLCARIEPLARELVLNAWSEPQFVSSYARWTLDILEQRRRCHLGIARKQKALLHRAHAINVSLFGMTALAATLHLELSTAWLSLVATFFPALGASLHGALAQSEAYRLGTTSARLAEDLQSASGRIRAALAGADPTPGGDAVAVKNEIEAALALILEEHPDWNLLVQPHPLPLA
jgi:hypothetical protein